jgi:DNA-directed RNA polymerase specialized sigma subunit
LELRKRFIAATASATSLEDESNLDLELLHLEKINLLQKYLLAMDKECQRLLRLFLQKLSLKEITEMLGFSSADYTKFRKYQCKNRLKKQIMEDPYCKWIMTYA